VDSATVLLTITVWAGEARVVILSGAMMKAVVCPVCLANPSSRSLPILSPMELASGLGDHGRHHGYLHQAMNPTRSRGPSVDH